MHGVAPVEGTRAGLNRKPRADPFKTACSVNTAGPLKTTDALKTAGPPTTAGALTTADSFKTAGTLKTAGSLSCQHKDHPKQQPVRRHVTAMSHRLDRTVVRSAKAQTIKNSTQTYQLKAACQLEGSKRMAREVYGARVSHIPSPEQHYQIQRQKRHQVRPKQLSACQNGVESEDTQCLMLCFGHQIQWRNCHEVQPNQLSARQNSIASKETQFAQFVMSTFSHHSACSQLFGFESITQICFCHRI